VRGIRPRRLRRLVHPARAVALGGTTRYEPSGTLIIDRREAEALVQHEALASVRVSVVSPGERARIVKVLDAVEPRAAAAPGLFPGLLCPATTTCPDEVHVLRGAAVVVAGRLPRAQEAIVEMSGPAAELSPLGQTHNVVIEFDPPSRVPWEEVDGALRRGALRLALRLAEAALEAAPEAVEELVTPTSHGADGSLPRVGVITNVQTQGAFKDVLVYGRTMADALPTLIDRNELERGAVVSAQYGHPALRNPTYLYQNHPVVEALRRRDGRELRFAGLVLSPEPVDQERKALVSAHAAAVCLAAGFDGVIVTKEGGGNADADASLKMDRLEELGIASVGLFAEMSGSDGTGPPLVVPPTRAAGMVSTGNYDERVRLERVERVLGGQRIDVADADADAELEVPMAVMCGALSSLGWGRLTCREVNVPCASSTT